MRKQSIIETILLMGMLAFGALFVLAIPAMGVVLVLDRPTVADCQ
jgi:hypothetical protein